MIRSGFFNSRNHDRLYYNADVSRLFNSLIIDGVFQNVGDKFIARAGSGMQVIIPSGMAYFNSTWIFNNTDYIQAVDAAPIVEGFSRIDGIFLKMLTENDHGDRENVIYYMAGEATSQNPSKPVPTSEAGETYIPICYITVASGVTSITAAVIENMVGKEECPFVSGILTTINAGELLRQWEAQWDEWLTLKQTEMTSDIASLETDWGTLWNTWFESVKDDLATVEVGDLKNKVDAITAMFVQNKTLYLPNTAASVANKTLILGMPLT